MRVAHITTYPPYGEKHAKTGGVASYAKNLVSQLSKTDKAEHIVLCDKTGAAVEEYEEAGTTVVRCFERSPRFVRQLHQQLKLRQPDVIHIQQELSLFGGILNAYLLQWLVFLWRERVVVTLHGVLGFSQVNARFVQQNNYRAPVWVVRFGLWFIYKPLTTWARKIIVHEENLKQMLVDEYHVPAYKVAVIPHGIEDFSAEPKATARQELGVQADGKVVLFMGYAAGYKGIDLLIEGFARFAKTNETAYLVIGAGAHPKLKDDPNYHKIYEGYRRKAAKLIPTNQYRWVGFIDEGDIAQYYSAADVSVYPYTTALASSGPMSIAIGYERPFLASDAFAGVFAKPLLFEKTAEAMNQKLQDFFAHPEAFEVYSRQLKKARLWRTVGQRTRSLYQEIVKKGVK